MTYQEYLNTVHWSALRERAYKVHGRTCKACGSRHNLHVHHLSYGTWFDRTEWDLMPLCERCHSIAHSHPELDGMCQSTAEAEGKGPKWRRFLLLIRVEAAKNKPTRAEKKETRKAAKALNRAIRAKMKRNKRMRRLRNRYRTRRHVA